MSQARVYHSQRPSKGFGYNRRCFGAAAHLQPGFPPSLLGGFPIDGGGESMKGFSGQNGSTLFISLVSIDDH